MFAPVKSLGLGVLIGALNPKNIAMAIAAALSIASVGLTGGQQVVVVVVYVVLAVLGVAAPVVVALVLGDRSQPVLASWKAWLERNNPVVMGVLFLVFSVVLVGKGIARSDLPVSSSNGAGAGPSAHVVAISSTSSPCSPRLAKRSNASWPCAAGSTSSILARNSPAARASSASATSFASAPWGCPVHRAAGGRWLGCREAPVWRPRGSPALLPSGP